MLVLLPDAHTLEPQESEEAHKHHPGQVVWSWLAAVQVRVVRLAMLGVVGALPRRHRQAIARVSVSALVASLPLLYVSLLRPPPAALAGDTAFWFLMSNCVIAAIVATADDPGALFSGSSCSDDGLLAGHEAAVVTLEGGGGVQDQQEVACSNPTDLVASPSLIEAEESADAANKPGRPDPDPDLPPSHMHASALHVERGEVHETATEQSSTAVTSTVKGHEEGEEMVVASSSPTPAPDDEASPAVGKLATVKADKALTATEPEAEAEAEPEPWVVPKFLLTSKSLPDQEVQEEDAADGKWPVALYSRPPGVVAHGMGGRLRRSATDGSKWAAEESEYWQLSDEELNRRVEDFIARFNRQMRLQIQHEAGF